MATVRRMEASLPLGFGLTFFVLAVNAVVCSWTIRRQVEDHRWVDHTREVQTGLAELRATLTDIMARQRSFLVTGDERGLAPYRDGVERSHALIAALRRLTADNPEQQARVAIIERQANALLAQLDRCLAARREQGIEAATAIVRSGRAESIGDEVGRTIATMASTERDLLERRESVMRLAIRRTILTLAAATVLSMTLLGFVFELTRSYIRRRDVADAARHQSEERFRKLAETTTFGLVFADPGGTLSYANPALLGMLGLGREEVEAGRVRWDELAPPEFAGRDAQAMHALEETGVCTPYEKQLVARDGRRVPILAGAVELERDPGGSPLIAVFVTDLTPLKEAERALREGEERFRTLAEAVPQIVWGTGPDGVHEYFNGRWYDYTGMTPEESIGPGWSRPIHPDDKARSVRCWAEATAAGTPYEIEQRFRAVDGSYRWFLGRALPVHDDAGRIVRWFGTCTDIEGQKRTEAALERAKEVAEAAGRAKDQFLAMLSHELRTPLNPVLMAATAALDHPGTPRDQRDTFEMIRQNVELEARLIDDLLDVMRVIRGKMHYRWSIVDLHVLINRTFDICRSDWLGKQIELVAPLEAGRRHVRADPARLQQVLWNLVKNAVKFTPAGGTITIGSRDDDGHVIVKVADTGLGIAPGDLQRIFNAFEQAEDPRTHKFGGLGLGLAISRSIAEAHGGTLTAESPGPDLGATFTLTLPTVVPLPKEEPVGPPDRTEVGRRQQLRLLLVEDDIVSSRIMSKLLRNVGHSVRTAHSVAAAIEAASPDLDLIVSDLGLPDGSGLDLMRRIKQEYGLSGIALTGFGMDDDIEKSRRAGFVAHLTKPVDFPRLEATIQRVAAMPDR